MNQNLTEIAIVLDRSGSMQLIWEPTIEGVNAFLAKQKEQPGDANVSIHLFDDHHDWLVRRAPLKNVMPLTKETYTPRGSTALNDAIGQTIDYIGRQLSITAEDSRPGKVIIVIVTDGMENCSREFTGEKVRVMIEHQRKTYNWEFIFLGANQDAVLNAAKIGIAAQSSMTYGANVRGVTQSFAAASVYTASARAGVSAAFSDEDRKAALGDAK